MLFKIDTRLLTKTLFISLLLVIALNNVAAILFYSGLLKGWIGYKIFSLLTVDFGASLPTYFNTLLILIAFIVLAMISIHLKNVKSVLVYNWLLLTLAFLVLSLDENPEVHKFFVQTISRYGSAGKRLVINYAWGMPYGAMVVLFMFFLFRFISALPKEIAKGFLVSGIIYVGGAIVIGKYGVKALQIRGFHNIRYTMVASIEESLEMIGLTLFIYFLLKYIRMEFKSFSFSVE